MPEPAGSHDLAAVGSVGGASPGVLPPTWPPGTFQGDTSMPDVKGEDGTLYTKARVLEALVDLYRCMWLYGLPEFETELSPALRSEFEGMLADGDLAYLVERGKVLALATGAKLPRSVLLDVRYAILSKGTSLTYQQRKHFFELAMQVRAAIKKRGKPPIPREKLLNAAELRKEGKPWAEIGENVGVNRDTIRKKLKGLTG